MNLLASYLKHEPIPFTASIDEWEIRGAFKNMSEYGTSIVGSLIRNYIQLNLS